MSIRYWVDLKFDNEWITFFEFDKYSFVHLDLLLNSITKNKGLPENLSITLKAWIKDTGKDDSFTWLSGSEIIQIVLTNNLRIIGKVSGDGEKIFGFDNLTNFDSDRVRLIIWNDT